MMRPVGNGHGFGNLTTCVNVGETDRKSYILSLTNLKHMQVHKNNNTVTLGAGWDLIDLIPALHEEGLQVHNLGSEMVQNYIGAATTGTHGTGKSNQNIATQIVGLRVLDARGTPTAWTIPITRTSSRRTPSASAPWASSPRSPYKPNPCPT